MRGRLTFRNAVLASLGLTWAVWNLLSYELTVELAGVQDKWQPFLTLVRVFFPFMYFGAPFLADWLAIVAFLLFPLVFLVLARYLSHEWSLKLGAIAGGVWAGAVALSAMLSPHESQAGRLYHLARGDFGEAVASALVIGVLEMLLVVVALNALVYWVAAFAAKWASRPRKPKPESRPDAESEQKAEFEAQPEPEATP